MNINIIAHLIKKPTQKYSITKIVINIIKKRAFEKR